MTSQPPPTPYFEVCASGRGAGDKTCCTGASSGQWDSMDGCQQLEAACHIAQGGGTFLDLPDRRLCVAGDSKDTLALYTANCSWDQVSGK